MGGIMTRISIADKSPVFIDTSAFYAMVNRSDCDHADARLFFLALIRDKVPMITSNFILSETYTLLLLRMGRSAAIQITERIRNSYEIERISEEDETQAWKIVTDYTDKDFSYVDATSFALMARLGLDRAFSFDDHFSQYKGVRKVPAPEF